MFYLILWSIFFSFAIILGIHWLSRFHRKEGKRNGNHYFILVKDIQGRIEWIIRSIHLWSFIEGKQEKITVFDLGSNDDTIEILDKMTYSKRKIDQLFRYDADRFAQNLGQMIEESIRKGEKPIILFLNKNEKSPKSEKFNSIIFHSGKMD